MKFSKTNIEEKRRPRTIGGLQKMIDSVYVYSFTQAVI